MLTKTKGAILRSNTKFFYSFEKSYHDIKTESKLKAGGNSYIEDQFEIVWVLSVIMPLPQYQTQTFKKFAVSQSRKRNRTKSTKWRRKKSWEGLVNEEEISIGLKDIKKKK